MPTALVHLIAAAMGTPVATVTGLIGVADSTFRRKDDAGEVLPDVAGHRLMALLRVAATLTRLLQTSGGGAALAGFDLAPWLAAWLREPQPAFSGKTPSEMLRNPEGQRAIEQLLERMRGGLPA